MMTLPKTPAGDGSPAGAGIDPFKCKRGRNFARFPRRRGDRPSVRAGSTSFAKVPPQARG